MSATIQYTTYGQKTYKVTEVTNQTDAELIDLCDYNNFGGQVIRHHNNTATVIVYTD